jgi:hypothetical protein
MKHERRFPLRDGDGEIVVRWRDTSGGPIATLHFNDQPLTITWRRVMTRNGATTIEPREHEPSEEDEYEAAHAAAQADAAPPRNEFPARGLVDDIDTLDVGPAQRAGATGLAALGASLDPKNWNTHRFVITGGHSASGVVYNSSVTSK